MNHANHSVLGAYLMGVNFAEALVEQPEPAPGTLEDGVPYPLEESMVLSRCRSGHPVNEGS